MNLNAENKTTVDLNGPTDYNEPNTFLYRVKRKVTYRNILSHVRKYLRNASAYSFLEIGTGSGFLVSIIENEFPQVVVRGIEFDPRLVKTTQDKVKNAKIIQANAEDFRLNEKFDVIVSSQVIEHLYNAKSMIGCVRAHLKPDGIFIFTTPNVSSVGAKVMGRKWHGFRSDHVTLKNCAQWKSIAEESGFIALYSGSTFFSGIPILNRLPFGLINWFLLLSLGSLKWRYGESYIGVFRRAD